MPDPTYRGEDGAYRSAEGHVRHLSKLLNRHSIQGSCLYDEDYARKLRGKLGAAKKQLLVEK